MTQGRHKVLIIDDELKIRENLLAYFEDYDELDVAGVDSSESALEMLPNSGIELCVVDLRLPGINGLEFIARAKEADLCRNYIIHTGSTELALAEELDRLGLPKNNLFQKPCNMKMLYERIIEIFANPSP